MYNMLRGGFMNEFDKVVDSWGNKIVIEDGHKIVIADACEIREQLLKAICECFPIIPNSENGLRSAIYIKDKGLIEPPKEGINSNFLPMIFNDYYNLLIVRNIIYTMINQISDVNFIKDFLNEFKYICSFEGNTLKEILEALDISLEIIRESYQE